MGLPDTVAAMSSSRDQVSVQRLIPATAEEIFDLLADPSRHADLDGSGHLVESREGSRRLKAGDTFGMAMKRGLFPYQTRNVVVTFEENRRISWQTLAPGPIAKLVTGRTWNYVLEPIDGGTLVTETWDISTEAPLARPAVRALLSDETRKSMTRTLERIEQLVRS